MGAALALPRVNVEAMQMHLDEISRVVAPRAHAVLLMDRAGWHSTTKLDVPKNITIVLLPSRSPELNPVENVWRYLRQNWLSNRVFKSYDAILDAACDAWNRLTAQPQTIMSIASLLRKLETIPPVKEGKRYPSRKRWNRPAWGKPQPGEPVSSRMF